MQRMIAVVMCAALVTSACASAGGPRVQSSPAPSLTDPALMASYVKQLPIGSRVRVQTTDGRKLVGTLMKTDDKAVVVRARTRLPEPPFEIPMERVLSVELDTRGGAGRAIAIGAAAGAGAAVGLLLLLAAIFAGD